MTDPSVTPPARSEPPKKQPNPKQPSNPWLTLLQKLWSDADSVSKWAQVVALLVTALWVGMKFYLLIWPTMSVKSNMTASLDGALLQNSDRRHVDFGVTISNDGITQFEVGRIEITAWRFGPYELNSSGNSIQKLEDLERTSAPLIPPYNPKSDALNRRPGTRHER